MSKNSSSLILGVILGAAMGAVAGLSFAPDKGEKTRKKMSSKAQELIKEGKKGLKKFNEEQLQPAIKKTEEEVRAGAKKINEEHIKPKFEETKAKVSKKAKDLSSEIKMKASDKK